MNIGDIVKGRCFGQYKKLRIKNIEDLGVMGKCYVCEDSKGNIFQYYSSQVGTLLLPRTEKNYALAKQNIITK